MQPREALYSAQIYVGYQHCDLPAQKPVALAVDGAQSDHDTEGVLGCPNRTEPSLSMHRSLRIPARLSYRTVIESCRGGWISRWRIRLRGPFGSHPSNGNGSKKPPRIEIFRPTGSWSNSSWRPSTGANGRAPSSISRLRRPRCSPPRSFGATSLQTAVRMRSTKFCSSFRHWCPSRPSILRRLRTRHRRKPIRS